MEVGSAKTSVELAPDLCPIPVELGLDWSGTGVPARVGAGVNAEPCYLPSRSTARKGSNITRSSLVASNNFLKGKLA